MEFKKYKLGELCRLSSSKRIFESEYVNNGIPFIRGQEISDKSILDENSKFECYISEERYNEIKEKYGVPQKGDILMTAVGTIGNLVVLNSNRPFYFKDGNVIRFSDFSELIDSTYLALFMKSPYFNKQIQYALIGAVQKALTMVMLSNIEIPLPEISIQKRIATILMEINSKIETNKKINKELEVMAKELYDYWFVQFDFPGANGKPYKSSGGKMSFNSILKRDIPEGWEIKSINDFCTSYRGVSYDKSDLLDGPEGGVLVLRGNNIDGNTLVYDDNVAYVPPSFVEPEQKIKKHDIIMTMSSGSKEHVGKCTMFQSDSEHTYGAFMTKFTPESECLFFAYRSMLSDFFKSKIKYICGGTGINNLTNQTFDEILFPFPPKDVLKEFEKLLTPIYEKVGKNNDEILRLTALRDELLPMLMNGQVTIK